MITLKFTLRSSLGADVSDNATAEQRRAVTARVVADLRAAADQIEQQGLTGLWSNVRGDDALLDADGYLRVGYALKRDYPHNTNDVHGPECPPIRSDK